MTTFFAELMRVILRVEFAYQFGWHYIWLESDSISVFACITSSSFAPPLRLHIAQSTCLSRIWMMSFYYSHIFRKGNIVVGIMANLGLTFTTLT